MIRLPSTPLGDGMIKIQYKDLTTWMLEVVATLQYMETTAQSALKIIPTRWFGIQL
jgi:hypothetical protein